MGDRTRINEEIRLVLEDVLPNQPQSVDRALTRIMEIIDPVEKIAREELERYRETFAELAK